jgi:hypothetical protein
VTKYNQRQGMSELLAKQRTGPPITPSEAARQRRSGHGGPAPDSADAGAPEDLVPAEKALAQEWQATRDQREEIVEPDVPEADIKVRTRIKRSRVAARARGRAAGTPRPVRPAARHVAQAKDRASAAAGIVNHAVPGTIRRTVSRAASNKGRLLTAACAVAVSVVCWLAFGRRRQATAQTAEPKARTRLPDKAGR